jgi:hypothetical protein
MGQTNVQTFKRTVYGESDYRKAAKRYDQFASKYSDLISSAADTTQEGIKDAAGLRDYYKPGGGYGEGQMAQGEKTYRRAQAETYGRDVSTGMSSVGRFAGANNVATEQLAMLQKNINDTQQGLLMQAFTPYAQMIQTLGNLASSGTQVASAAPKSKDYITFGDREFTGFKPMTNPYTMK